MPSAARSSGAPVHRAALYLFDIDGTLLDAHGSGRAAFDAVMHAQQGIADASRGMRYGGKTDPALIDEMFVARLGRPASTQERAAFLDAYLPHLHARLAAGGVRVHDGAVEALEYLKPRTRLGIATGNVRAGAEAKLAAAGLDRWFELVPADRGAPGPVRLGGYGCDSRLRAELVARAIERAGVPASEVVVVGDTTHDIAAARACGAVVCAVATGSDPADRLDHADGVLASLRELPAWHATRFG